MKAVLALLSLLSFVTACSEKETYTDRQPPVMLMDRFPSYESEHQVMTLLSGMPSETVVRSALPASDKRPPFNVVELSVANYSHLGYAGELRLEFFNDRLMSVWFYPIQYEGYLAELRRRGTTVGTVGDDVPDRNPSVITHHDHRNQLYVTWQDVRLLKQNERWIERYS